MTAKLGQLWQTSVNQDWVHYALIDAVHGQEEDEHLSVCRGTGSPAAMAPGRAAPAIATLFTTPTSSPFPWGWGSSMKTAKPPNIECSCSNTRTKHGFHTNNDNDRTLYTY